MKLRIEKINHLAHLITNHLVEASSVTLLQEKNDVRLKIKEIIINELKLDDEIDRKTKQILASYSRQIPEGSREWDVLYRKTFDEEMEKRRQGI
ncbi:DUF507 family protein [bacterium]|nr:DUF507 family protein [bacterium]